ncbi:MAG: hypothetical protein LBU14_03645 [Candidatus Peribacteria bacterium]|jgi:hypothetical protein|nr:hypothetical protein [Candidatus Peribacteria bacterium]
MLKKLEEEHNAEFGNQMSLVDLIKIQEENNRKLKTEKEKQLQSNCHFEFLVPLNDGDVTK